MGTSTNPAIVDLLRDELRRQARNNPDLSVATAPDHEPDTMRVAGLIDLYELAKAIAER